MIQTISKTITFDEFVAWYPENSVHKYELHNGVIVEMPLGISGPFPRYRFHPFKTINRN